MSDLIERARELPEDPILAGKIARAILPALCYALEQAQAELAQLRAERDAADYLLAEGDAHDAADFDGEVARLTHDNLNYAVNVCPEQDRIIAKLTAAVTAFLEFCDVPQCDPEGPYNPDYGKHIFDLFKRAEDLAREATK